MNVPNLQNSTAKKAGLSQEVVEIVTIGLQHIGQGFVAFIGFSIINFYFVCLGMNLSYGNQIVFVPGLMLLAAPLVLIIVGAINSYSLQLIYNRGTSQHWFSLFAQGLFVGIVGLSLSFFWNFLFIVVIFRLLRRPDTFSGGPFMPFIFMTIPFILYVPTLGYAVKEISLHFTKTNSEVTQQDEQRLDVSPKDGAN